MPKSVSHFQLANYQSIARFCKVTGLQVLKLKDIHVKGEDRYTIANMHQGKGGLHREVPIRSGYEGDMLDIVMERDPDDCMFAQVPYRLHIHTKRRVWVQEHSCEISVRPLPDLHGRLHEADYDEDTAITVNPLAHDFIDFVTYSYLR